jgi:hypothetical protein
VKKKKQKNIEKRSYNLDKKVFEVKKEKETDLRQCV